MTALDARVSLRGKCRSNEMNAKTVLNFNYVWWADHRDELDERFQAWLAQ